MDLIKRNILSIIGVGLLVLAIVVRDNFDLEYSKVIEIALIVLSGILVAMDIYMKEGRKGYSQMCFVGVFWLLFITDYTNSIGKYIFLPIVVVLIGLSVYFSKQNSKNKTAS